MLHSNHIGAESAARHPQLSRRILRQLETCLRWRAPTGQQRRRFADPKGRAYHSPFLSRDIQRGADMTPLTPETISAWLVDWSLLAAAGDAMPPRDPDDDDEDEEDEEDEDGDEEPPVVREPDE
jgi:hypothetical protein